MSSWACIASGPSLELEDIELLRDRIPVMVVNDNWKLAPWAQVLYAADYDWWFYNIDELDAAGFAGECWTQNHAAAVEFDLNWIPSAAAAGLSTGTERIHQGLNSGFQAINLALVFMRQARELPGTIVLLGYDMQNTGGRRHWFGDHRPGLRKHSPLNEFRDQFKLMDPGAHQVEIINCSRATALDFPRMEIGEAIERYSR